MTGRATPTVGSAWSPSTHSAPHSPSNVYVVDFPFRSDCLITSLCLVTPPLDTLTTVLVEYIREPWLICSVFLVVVRYRLLYNTGLMSDFHAHPPQPYIAPQVSSRAHLSFSICCHVYSQPVTHAPILNCIRWSEDRNARHSFSATVGRSSAGVLSWSASWRIM